MKRFARNLDAGAYLDAFLVTAVGAVILIRLSLHLTGYPRVGGDSFHIAHVLWGGLLMAAALVVVMSFLGRTALRWAVFLGGLGFGVFIDEVGKFVTKDNDYFFQPSVAIMYATFVVLYLLGRLIQSHRGFARSEYLVNSLVEMEELALQDLDRVEKERAKTYLAKSDPENPLTKALETALARAELVPRSEPRRFSRIRTGLQDLYQRVAHQRGFFLLLIFFFCAQLLIKASSLFFFLFLRDADIPRFLNGRFGGFVQRAESLAFTEKAEIVIGAVEALFVLAGIIRLRTSRLQAYRLFRASILLYLFMTQIFVFAREEWSGLVGFVFNLLILVALAFLIDREKMQAGSGRPGPPSSG